MGEQLNSMQHHRCIDGASMTWLKRASLHLGCLSRPKTIAWPRPVRTRICKVMQVIPQEVEILRADGFECAGTKAGGSIEVTEASTTYSTNVAHHNGDGASTTDGSLFGKKTFADRILRGLWQLYR